MVCDLVSIHASTYYEWQENSEKAERDKDADSPFYQFSDRCKAAQASAEEKALRIVLNAAKGGQKVTKTVTRRKYLVEEVADPDYGPGNEGKRRTLEADRKLLEEDTTVTVEETLPDSRAAMWFLERRNRKEYGRQVGVVGPDGGPVQLQRTGRTLLESLDDDGLEALEGILARAGGTAGGDEPAGGEGGDRPPEGP